MRTPTNIYHLTHVDNLPSIMAKGVVAPNLLQEVGIDRVDIAYTHIQERRSNTFMDCGPGGTIHDYAPFYFAPRSPMLFTISRGNVPNYDQGQEPLVYLVSSVQLIQRAGLPYVFSTRHCDDSNNIFYDDPQHLTEVDWDVMDMLYWSNKPEQPDRKSRRQAEFLVHRTLPWEWVGDIVTMTEEVLSKVEELIRSADYKPRAEVRRDWFFDPP